MIAITAAGLLRRHVCGGADRRAGLRQSRCALKSGQPKVEQLGATITIDQDVRRFDVTMDDSRRVRFTEAIGNLHCERKFVLESERA